VGKQSGLGDNLYVGGYNLSGDIGMIDNVSCPRGTLPVTPISADAFERIYGRSDGQLEYTSFYNVDPGRSHAVHSALPRTSVMLTYARGTTLGAPAACLIAKQTNYDMSRGDDGSLTFKIQAVAAEGYSLEWGRQLTAGIRTDTAATLGGSIDDTAATALGLQAYLQVTALTGTDITIKLQESSDNGVGDAWADVVGGSFTQILAAGFTPTTQRIATSGALPVERYLRAVSTTVGGVTSCSFSLVVVRNLGGPP
jgi:hypothetical protein